MGSHGRRRPLFCPGVRPRTLRPPTSSLLTAATSLVTFFPVAGAGELWGDSNLKGGVIWTASGSQASDFGKRNSQRVLSGQMTERNHTRHTSWTPVRIRPVNENRHLATERASARSAGHQAAGSVSGGGEGPGSPGRGLGPAPPSRRRPTLWAAFHPDRPGRTVR